MTIKVKVERSTPSYDELLPSDDGKFEYAVIYYEHRVMGLFAHLNYAVKFCALQQSEYPNQKFEVRRVHDIIKD